MNRPQNGSERDRLLAEATREFLKRLPPSLAEAVWAAAVPHWFDGEILARTLGIPEEDAAARYARLQEMPFVQPVAGRGHAVHELTRRLLLDDLWRDRREAFRVWSRRAAEAFESRPDDPDFLLESIYHWLVADPDRGADRVWNWGAEWNNTFQYARLHALVQAGLEHEEAGRLEGRARGWVLFRKGQLHILYNEYRAAKTALEGALESAGGDRQLEAHCIKALGDVHLRLGEYGAARGRYEEALGIYREIGDRLGEANCIKALGDVHLRLGEYGAARGRYEEALGIYREISDRLGEANCIQALGEPLAPPGGLCRRSGGLHPRHPGLASGRSLLPESGRHLYRNGRFRRGRRRPGAGGHSGPGAPLPGTAAGPTGLLYAGLFLCPAPRAGGAGPAVALRHRRAPGRPGPSGPGR